MNMQEGVASYGGEKQGIWSKSMSTKLAGSGISLPRPDFYRLMQSPHYRTPLLPPQMYFPCRLHRPKILGAYAIVLYSVPIVSTYNPQSWNGDCTTTTTPSKRFEFVAPFSHIVAWAGPWVRCTTPAYVLGATKWNHVVQCPRCIFRFEYFLGTIGTVVKP